MAGASPALTAWQGTASPWLPGERERPNRREAGGAPMRFLSDQQMRELLPAEEAALPSPVPTQVVSSEEYFPPPQTAQQKEFEARLIGAVDRFAGVEGFAGRGAF